MNSLINDDSFINQQLTSKAINHSSLIVDSAARQHKLTGEASILSQERYTGGSKKSRGGQNAMSEMRKSTKVPLGAQKQQA